MAEHISANNLELHKNDFVIIDVRESDEISKGKIEHSMHIPLGLVIRKVKHGEFADLKEKKLCTYCTNGYRGNIAADELKKAGFNALSLDGGFFTWEHLHNKTNEITEIIPDVIPEEKKPLEPPSENYEDDLDEDDYNDSTP